MVLINDSIAKKVLEAALETGGDFSEIFLEDTEGTRIQMQDGRTDSATYKRSRGAGVRVLLGNCTGYAYTADLSESALIATARLAAAILSAKKSASASGEFAKKDYSEKLQMPFSEFSNAQKIALLKQATESARDVSKEISQISASYLDVDRRIEIYNSNGIFAADRQCRTRIMLNAVATDGVEAQTGYFGPGYGTDFSAYKKIDPEMVGKEAANIAVTMLHGKECPAGVMPVVIDGGFGGVILHEACVHSLEATAVAKGNSEFCGKLGQKVASDIVTAIDDGTMPGEWGSVRVDDEGTPSARNVLIENGVLKSYLVDMVGARTMNHHLTGSSRRQDYTVAPTSRMTNTFFADGNDDNDEIIKSMAEGLYARSMGGGSVNPLTGDFNFTVLEGYWVKNGEIVCPVRGATLIGRGADVIKQIDRVGKGMWLGQGMCGSKSGFIPTNVGQPRIRISEITVGGKGGAI